MLPKLKGAAANPAPSCLPRQRHETTQRARLLHSRPTGYGHKETQSEERRKPGGTIQAGQTHTFLFHLQHPENDYPSTFTLVWILSSTKGAIQHIHTRAFKLLHSWPIPLPVFPFPYCSFRTQGILSFPLNGKSLFSLILPLPWKYSFKNTCFKRCFIWRHL